MQNFQNKFSNLQILIENGEMLEIESFFDYGHYDYSAYDFMINDKARMDAYREAFKGNVLGKKIIDAGAGDRAPLAVMCAEEGAEAILGVEKDKDAARLSHYCAQNGMFKDKISIIHSDILDLPSDNTYDICVHDLIGHIASCEGMRYLLNYIRRNLLKKGGKVIPGRVKSHFALAKKPKFKNSPEMEQLREDYRNSFNKALGKSPTYKTLIYNFPVAALLSDSMVLEDLNTNELMPEEESGSVVFHVIKEEILDSICIWTEIYFNKGNVLSTFSGTCWAPVVVPLEEKLKVRIGDQIHCKYHIKCKDGQVYPDYLFELSNLQSDFTTVANLIF